MPGSLLGVDNDLRQTCVDLPASLRPGPGDDRRCDQRVREADAVAFQLDHAGGDCVVERIRLLLREIFTACGGTHDDWDTYDRVMAEERRTAVLVAPERVYS